MNFAVSSIAYLLLVITLSIYLQGKRSFPENISVFDFVLILFATLRLTEFFVYDKSMQFFRDLFVDVKKPAIVKNEMFVETTPTKFGIRRTIHDLIECPWCTSVWTATLITFLYFLFPSLWIFILILAISGGATIIQLATNMIGWTSERTEQEVEKKEGNKK